MKTKCITFLSLLLMMMCSILSCNHEDNSEILPEEPTTDEEWLSITPLLFESEFEGKSFYITSCMTDSHREYHINKMLTDQNTYLRIKTRSEAGTSDWISYGKVCGMASAVKFNKKMQEIYKDKCYEMKADTPDKEECRMMYHRPCQ